jgi:hypothetical protein
VIPNTLSTYRWRPVEELVVVSLIDWEPSGIHHGTGKDGHAKSSLCIAFLKSIVGSFL